MIHRINFKHITIYPMRKKILSATKKTYATVFFIFISTLPISGREVPVNHISASIHISTPIHISAPINISTPGITTVAYKNVPRYDSLALGNAGLSKDAYEVAVRGFDSLRSAGILHNEKILSIVDFSLPSFKKRLFVIDIESGKIIYNTFVSHGRNSGKEMATLFSNKSHSYQSSLGFFITGETYRGHHGYSLRLQGMEEGINDNAFSRGIVIHAARYVNEMAALKEGTIGRSEGCPAIPVDIHRAIIDEIKNGTCLFVYGSDKHYFSRSKFVQKLRMV